MDEFSKVLKHYKIFQDEDNYKVICPFHNDKNSSLQITRSKKFFYCYGCGAKGTTLDLIKFFERCSYAKALEIKKSICSGCETNAESKLMTILQIEKASESFDLKKKNTQQARSFYYSLPEVNWYKCKEEEIESKRYLNKRGFKNSTLKKVGCKITYNDSYPIVFPILENDVFRGYVMRTMSKEIEQSRKYLYNSGFSRSSVLAGTYEKNAEYVLVVEGYLDCIKAMQFGIKNVVALLGWKMSARQKEKLKKVNVKNIICALDNDEAGRRGYEFLKTCNEFNVYRLRYSKGIKDFGDVTDEEFVKIKRQIKKIRREIENEQCS